MTHLQTTTDGSSTSDSATTSDDVTTSTEASIDGRSWTSASDSVTTATEGEFTTPSTEGGINNEVTSTASGNSGDISSEDRSSDTGTLSEMEIGIFAAAGFIFIALIIISICVCCRCIRAQKKRNQTGQHQQHQQQHPSHNQEASHDVHLYKPKITKMHEDTASSNGTQRYTRDPTDHLPISGSGEEYQVIPDMRPGDSWQMRQNRENQGHPRNDPYVTGQNRGRQVLPSGEYSGFIQGGYRGSKKHLINTDSGHSNGQEQNQGYASRDIEMQPYRQQQGQYGREVAQVPQHGTHDCPPRSPPYQLVYDRQINPVGSQPMSDHQQGRKFENSWVPQQYNMRPNEAAPPTQSQHQQNMSANIATQNPSVSWQRQQPATSITQQQLASNQPDPYHSRDTRMPRHQPQFVPYNQTTGQYQPRYQKNPNPPPTQPKPSRNLPPQSNVDMTLLKQNLKPSKTRPQENKPAEVNDLALNPLFNKVKQVIDSGCKTIRLYRTSKGFAVQGFQEDEQEIYNDAVTSSAHLPPESEAIMDYHHDGNNENVYDFIRSSVLVNTSTDANHGPGDVTLTSGDASQPHEEMQGQSHSAQDVADSHGYNEELYDEASDIQAHSDRREASARKLPHDALKEEFNKIGFLQELQGRQTRDQYDQEDYENVNIGVPMVAGHSASQSPQSVPTQDYVNEQEINNIRANAMLIGDADPHGQGEYANHEAIRQREGQGQPTDSTQENYENKEVIDQIRKDRVNAAFQPDYQQEDYENGSVIEEMRRNPPTPSGGDCVYQNSADARSQVKPVRHLVDDNNGPDADFAAKMAARRNRLTLRSSMCDAELGQNVENLFDDVLGDSLQEIKQESNDSKHLPPVLRKKSVAKENNGNTDNRISRSSFFTEIEEEAGPDRNDNMGGWHQREVVTPQMMATGTKALPKAGGGGLFKFFRS